jgi:phosphopantothenoylcysteine decarboxylase/phosphopantothenate--cysteine ligase
MSKQPHIVLGVTGSIAAYKAAELVRLMTGEAGWSVSVMMTASATKYVGALTFEALSGNPVAVGRFESMTGDSFQHIHLAREADVVLLAPCTANVMAKLACGLADDLLTSTVLASDAPLLIAPAMNTVMWNHPATQANRTTLIERGVHLLPVGEGDLACGEVGAGRLCSLSTIIDAVRDVIDS